MAKCIILAVILTTVNGGFLNAPASVSYYSSGLASPAGISYGSPAALAGPAAITSSHSNILRSPGNLGQVSTYSKTIDTPYSSVSKSDVRVSNPGVAYSAAAPAIASYAAPAYSSSYYGSAAYSRGYGLAAVAAPASVSYSSSLAAPASVSYSSLAAPAAVSYSSLAAPAALASPAAVTSSHSNILRSPGNLRQISTFSKTIDTPYSSVSKSDVRVSNPGVAYSAAAPAIASYAAPAYSSSYYGSAAYSRGYGLSAVTAPASVSYSSSLAAPASVSYSSLAAPAAVSYSSLAAPAALASPAAVTSSHSNILRSPGNLRQISTFSKTIDTPYSSVSKSDVRVSNPGVAYSAAAPAIASYAAPAYSSSYYGSAAYSRGYGLAAVAAPASVSYSSSLAAPASVSYSSLAAPAAVSYSSLADPAALASPAAITSSHSNILRSPGNLGQVSTYSKTIDTPYSSVSKSDVRVSNPGVAYSAAAPAIASYAAPAYSSSYYGSAAYSRGYGLAAVAAPASVSYSSSLAAPASVSYSSLAAPAAVTSSHSNILRTPGNLGQVSTYSKTIDTPYSSVSKSDVRVSNSALAYGSYGAVSAPAYATSSYGFPSYARAYASPTAYVPGSVASHVSFSGLGAYYNW